MPSAATAAELHELAAGGGWASARAAGQPGELAPRRGGIGDGDDGEIPAAVSRLILTAQEDLRRDIARAMHDGPAQSLTNIVLQAQIVDRLVERDPVLARAEVKALIAMVQTTLEATKSFIFDVRPMVLDDLGLVPTIRRAARERGRRAQIVVDFDSLGSDRRLAMELESGLFRMIDQALAGYLSTAPPAGRDPARLGRPDRGPDRRPRRGAGAPEPRRPRRRPTRRRPAALSPDDRRPADGRGRRRGRGRGQPRPAGQGLARDPSSGPSTLGMVAELLAGGTEVRLVSPIRPSDENRPALLAAQPARPKTADRRRPPVADARCLPARPAAIVDYAIIGLLTLALIGVLLVFFRDQVADDPGLDHRPDRLNGSSILVPMT